MSRFFAVLFFVCFSIAYSVIADESPKRPNILFIFSDDHATQAIGAYGSKINETPNLDRIANEGMLFRNSFCANSICGPSRACILTGKHSHLNGFRRNGNRFDGSQVTFPKLMQRSGYQTAIIGKWHLGSDPTGFDHWEVLPGQGNYYNPDFLQMDGSRKRFKGYCTDLITEKALTWLHSRGSDDRPFLLMCQHKAPHRNWSPPVRHYTLYDDLPIEEPQTLFDDYSGRNALLKQNEMTISNHMHWGHDMKLKGDNEFPKHFAGKHANREYDRMTDEQKAAWDSAYEPKNRLFLNAMRGGKLSDKDVIRWKYQRYIKDYLRCVQAVDDSVGELLQYLDDAGLAKNTIVIYSSDQGFYLGEHGWYDKRWMFEESLQMPLMIRWPGVVDVDSESEALIQNIDYAPTFLEIAGVDIPESIQGDSMMELLRNDGAPDSTWRDAIYYAYYENAGAHNVPVHDGVRTDRYKLMFYPRSRSWDLFDLEKDPTEMVSIHDDPNYANVLRGMKHRYHALRDHYEVNSAVIPATRGDQAKWRDRFAKQTAEAKRGKAKIAFLGDSITQGWEGAGKNVWKEYYAKRQPINLGIGGDRTEHLIWRLRHGKTEKLAPDVAVLMIGTNNTGHFMQDPAEVAQGVKAVLDLMKRQWPDTMIVLQAIFPRGKDSLDVARLNNLAINSRIRKFADGDRIRYVDLGRVFLSPDGRIDPKIMPDQLHLSEEGYRLWASALEPTLVELGL